MLLRILAGGGEETKLFDGVRERSWALTADGVWYLWADGPRHAELRFFDFKTSKAVSILTLSKPVSARDSPSRPTEAV
jgi:hypothetical protein